MEKELKINTCSTCKHLNFTIERTGFAPKCKKNKLKFKQLRQADYTDNSLTSSSCELYENFK